MEHGYSDFCSAFLGVFGKSGNLLNSSENGNSVKKMEIVIFLGTGPQNHLYSLSFIGVFAMGSFLTKK